MKCYSGPQTWMDSLEQHRQRKMDMRFGTWNVSRFSENSSKLVGEVKLRSKGNTSSQMGQG